MRKSYTTVLKGKLGSGHFLWPFQQAMKYPLIKLSRSKRKSLTGPLHATIFCTYACNLRCYFCGLPDLNKENISRGEKELSTEEMFILVRDLAAIKTTAIGFTGGEPMIRRDMPNILEKAVKLNILVHLSSNGYAFRSLDSTRDILDIGVHATSISVDSSSAGTHDKMRGMKGSFDLVMKGIENINTVKSSHKNKISLTTTTILTDENLDEVEPLIKLLRENYVSQIGFIPGHNFIWDDEQKIMKCTSMIKDEKKANAVIDFLIKSHQSYKDIENTPQYLNLMRQFIMGKPMPYDCYAGYATLAVDSWGNIFPCFTYAEVKCSFDNIRNIPLKEYWKSQQINVMRDRVRECHACYWNNQTEINLLF